MKQTNHAQAYKDQQRVSFLTFLAELPNFVAVGISAIVSGSLLVWMDFVDSLGNVINAGFVSLLSHKLRRDLKYEYNYGIGKIEAISSLCCDGILICGLIFMLISSVHDIIMPKQPSGLLIYVVALKVVNVAFDTYFLLAQYKMKKAGGSAITVTEFHTALKSFAFDTVALVSLLICWVFRGCRAVWYFSPVICIILAGIFFASAVIRVKKAVAILTDRTLPEKEQMIILNVLSQHYDGFEQLEFLSSRQSGGSVFIDLRLRFRDDTTYAQIKALCRDITRKIGERIENSKVSIVIDDTL